MKPMDIEDQWRLKTPDSGVAYFSAFLGDHHGIRIK